MVKFICNCRGQLSHDAVCGHVIVGDNSLCGHDRLATCVHQQVKEIKPLFIPLKTEYYEAFANGSKVDELRCYGPRWNEETCKPGREVVLSKGYGKQSRLKGSIWKFKRQHGSLFGSTYKEAIKSIYGTLDIDIACISVTDLEPVKFGTE